MSKPIVRFVTVPYITTQTLEPIHYRDIYIYFILKSFNNSDADLCFPSYDTIAKIGGMGRTFVRQSIYRLELAELIKVHRSDKKRKVNHYYFPALESYNRVPLEVLYADLTSHQKAILISLSQFFILEGVTIPRNLKDKAERLGLTYKTLYSQYQPLVENGYVHEFEKFYKHSNTSKLYHELTDKIKWIFPYAIAEQLRENKLDENCIDGFNTYHPGLGAYDLKVTKIRPGHNYMVLG